MDRKPKQKVGRLKRKISFLMGILLALFLLWLISIFWVSGGIREGGFKIARVSEEENVLGESIGTTEEPDWIVLSQYLLKIYYDTELPDIPYTIERVSLEGKTQADPITEEIIDPVTETTEETQAELTPEKEENPIFEEDVFDGEIIETGGGGSSGSSDDSELIGGEFADMDITAVTVTNSDLISPGDLITANIQVKNNGKGTCPEAVLMKVFLIPSQEVVYKAVPSLQAGQSYSFNITATDHLQTALEGRYQLVVSFQNDPGECVANDANPAEELRDNDNSQMISVFQSQEELEGYAVDLFVEDLFHHDIEGGGERMIGIILRNRGYEQFRATDYSNVRLFFENKTTGATAIYHFSNEIIDSWGKYLIILHPDLLQNGYNDVMVRLEVQDADLTNNSLSEVIESS